MPKKLPSISSTRAKLPLVKSKYVSKLPFVAAMIGSCGSGKSYGAIALTKLMRQEGSINFVFLICPTYKSNDLYHVIKPDVVYEDLHEVNESLLEIQESMTAKADAYRKDLEYEVARKLFVGGDTVTPAQELLLESRDYANVKAVRPRCLLIIDDCSHSPIFSTSKKNRLTNLVLRHRHEGGGLGLSIMMIAQTYTSGIPRALRQNLDYLAIFHTESEKEIKSLYEEIGGMVSFKRFNEVFQAYTKEKHAFLWVDKNRRTLEESFMP